MDLENFSYTIVVMIAIMYLWQFTAIELSGIVIALGNKGGNHGT